MIFGEVRSKRGGRRDDRSRVSYSSFYDRKDYAPRRPGRTFEYDNVYLDTRQEAEDVIERMEDILEQYGSVSVGDLYDLCDVSGDPTDWDYGWRSLRDAYSERTRDGFFTIKLPRPKPLK